MHVQIKQAIWVTATHNLRIAVYFGCPCIPNASVTLSPLFLLMLFLCQKLCVHVRACPNKNKNVSE
jgi:hypothetical protein